MAMTVAERSARYRAKDVDAYRAQKNALTKTQHHREVRRLYQQKWRAANREKHNAISRTYYQKNKVKVAVAARKQRLKREYDMTPEDYGIMLAAQNGLCAICGGGPRGRAKFHVDHCHSTDMVRGILCNKCNTNLGVLEVWYASLRPRIDAYLSRPA